jgi:hypothetical protein
LGFMLEKNGKDEKRSNLHILVSYKLVQPKKCTNA